jgi:hypothetical protein
MSGAIEKQRILLCGISFAEQIGLNEALLLQQLFYWQIKSGANEWLYNPYKVWQEQLKFLSLRTIRRTFASLVKQGFLESRKGKACKFYKLHYETASNFLLDSSITEFHIDGVNPVVVKPKTQAIQKLEEKNELQQLLDIWQRKIPPDGQSLKLTIQRKVVLQKLFATFFDSKLENWTNFVDKIVASPFLMGKVTKFKVFFDWAIVPQHCIKILEGAYSNKNTSSQKQILPDKIFEHVNASLELIEDKDWREAAKLLVQILGCAGYQSWFSKVKFKGYQNNRIYLEAETRFISDWIDSHYLHKVKQAWQDALGKNVDSVIIKPQHPNPTPLTCVEPGQFGQA